MSAEGLVKTRRAGLLASCDWTQLPDAPLTDREREEWQRYRHALRNLSSQPGYPDNVQWPTPPVTDRAQLVSK